MSVIITGTGTNVGKTILSALIMAKYGKSKLLHYWKPVQTGVDRDADHVKSLSQSDEVDILPSSYIFKAAASPHYAATQESQRISLSQIVESYQGFQNKNIILEGAGGLYVPLNEKVFMLDLFSSLKLPVILVVSSLLGTINSSLLSLYAMQRAGLTILGFYMYGPENELMNDNIQTIEKFSGLECFGHYFLEPEWFDPEKFTNHAKKYFDTEDKIGRLL